MRLPAKEAEDRRQRELRTSNAKALISNIETFYKFIDIYEGSDSIEEFKVKADIIGFSPINSRHWFLKYISWKDAFIWKYNQDNTGYTGSKKAGIIFLLCAGAVMFLPALIHVLMLIVSVPSVIVLCGIAIHYVNKALTFANKGTYHCDAYMSMFEPYNNDMIYDYMRNRSSR